MTKIVESSANITAMDVSIPSRNICWIPSGLQADTMPGPGYTKLNKTQPLPVKQVDWYVLGLSVECDVPFQVCFGEEHFLKRRISFPLTIRSSLLFEQTSFRFKIYLHFFP